MEEKLPGCGLKADPHIESKIKTLKRHLAYILAIEENGDGFWWDDEQTMVVGNKEAFLCWAKVTFLCIYFLIVCSRNYCNKIT